MQCVYLTGASNEFARAAGSDDLYGRLGLMLNPRTVRSKAHLAKDIPHYCGGGWALDNGCFYGPFDADAFSRSLDHCVQEVDGAHDSVRFAVAPDVFDRDKMQGDALRTIDQSLVWFDRIRDAGAPAALVFQDGLTADVVPWGMFDVAFIGGSDQFKLGYPDFVKSGNPHYAIDANGAKNPATRQWLELIAECHRRDVPIHVGRVSSRVRWAFCESIGAESCDGTYLSYGPRKNLDRVRSWVDGWREAEGLGLASDVINAGVAS